MSTFLERVLSILAAFGNVVRIVWAAPVTVPCFLLYVLPCFAMGWYRFYGCEGCSLIFVHANLPGWFESMWSGWAGHCVGTCVVVRNDPRMGPSARRTLVHELTHARQVMTWGVLQPVAYFVSSIAACMAGESCYECNAFEIAARRAAGQKLIG